MEPSDSSKAQAPHPMGVAIDRLVHRTQDAELAVREFLPLAQEHKRKTIERTTDELKNVTVILAETDRTKRAFVEKHIFQELFTLERAMYSDIAATLESGLFLALFSAFDAFTGELLRAMYARRPELFGFLNRTLTFSEVLRRNARA